jgi:hypothetical protein
MPSPSPSPLRSRLATLSTEELRRGHKDAVMRFALAGSIEAARVAHAEAVEWTEEVQRRDVNPQAPEAM